MPLLISRSKHRRASAPPSPTVPDHALAVDLAAIRRAARRESLAKEAMDTPQMRLYGRWWNHWLQERGLAFDGIGDVMGDGMCSGVLPLAMAEMLTGEKAAVHHAKPKDDDERRQNQLAAMGLLRAFRVPLVSANGSQRQLALNRLPEDVDEYAAMASKLLEGSHEAFASLTWSLILHVDCGSRPDCPSQRALSELLTWAREAATPYCGVEIGRTRYAWSQAFEDGMAWCALVDAHDPTLLDLDAVSRMEPEERLAAFFSMAERELDVPLLCDAGTQAVDDPRIAITVTAQLRNALQAREMFAEQSQLEVEREASEKEAAAERQRLEAEEERLREAARQRQRLAAEEHERALLSMSKHSVAWQLRRKREALSGTPHSPSKARKPLSELRPWIARASSEGGATPRLTI